MEMAGAAEAFEAVEKDGHRGVVDPLEGFANTLPGDRRQELEPGIGGGVGAGIERTEVQTGQRGNERGGFCLQRGKERL